MLRIAGSLLGLVLALARAGECTGGATPAAPDKGASTANEPRGGSTEAPTADDVCHALEHSAAENALPVEFFARVIWQKVASMRGRSAPREPSGRKA
jgi:hypothetical protein